MKKTFLLSALLLTSLSATFVSCKKEDKEKSRQELIVGSWNLTALGVDANKNNKLEPTEQDTLDLSETNRQTFNADGSGESEYSDAGRPNRKTPFSWVLSNDGQSLRVIQGDTSNVTITLLTQDRFEFYMVEDEDHNFAVLTR